MRGLEFAAREEGCVSIDWAKLLCIAVTWWLCSKLAASFYRAAATLSERECV